MGESIMKRAQTSGIIDFYSHDLRDYTHDPHRTTDDYPYGGGKGLLMKCEPIFECLEDIIDCEPGTLPYLSQSQDIQSCVKSNLQNEVYGSGVRVLFLSPHGRRFDDSYACELAVAERLIFICGHYEGIDERAYTLATDMVSMGDYILTGGELASLCVTDAVVRKIPGALGADDGAAHDSFAQLVDGLLEYPQYTRPSSYRNMDVPEVLLSGHHKNIADWQRLRSLETTMRLRPDLLENARLQSKLTAQEETFIARAK
jgi:tRNA (guanine37-N1)-methyltransferase